MLTLLPALTKIYLFEPVPSLALTLEEYCSDDERIHVLATALSNLVGKSSFFVANNNCASSSLLPMSRHVDIFPYVHYVATITVLVATIHTLVNFDRLLPPDFLLLDAQGSELAILQGARSGILHQIAVIYLEASEYELYSGSGTLSDIKKLLDPCFEFVGFEPFPAAKMHGNALFINRIRR